MELKASTPLTSSNTLNFKRIHSMELKDPVDSVRVAVSPALGGIHSMELKALLIASLPPKMIMFWIHSMELKVPSQALRVPYNPSENPFNGIESRPLRGSPISFYGGGGNPFNGIESYHGV